MESIFAGSLKTSHFNIKDIRKRHLSYINKIILHCSDTDNEKVTIERINDWHKSSPKNWAGCGYHYFIDSNGLIWIGRKEDWIGCHCRGQNLTSIGICINGKYHFNKKQSDALIKLITNITLRYKDKEFKQVPMQCPPFDYIAKLMPIVGHKMFDFYEKTCPNFCVDYFLASGNIIPFESKKIID